MTRAKMMHMASFIQNSKTLYSFLMIETFKYVFLNTFSKFSYQYYKPGLLNVIPI